MANLIGPDVSFYQDDPETPQGIDFFKMRDSAGYVIIRAGQNLWADSDFKGNWREAKLAGLPRGSYWFYDSRADPKKQAELWVQQFEGDPGELPMFADFEETYNGTYKGWKNWYNFLERLKQLLPTKEIAIYTGYFYWLENAPSPAYEAASLEYFHKYPLWIANYGNPEPMIPKPWGKNEWLFWQFTDNGIGGTYGVESGNIDLNYFNGDLAAFRARFKLSDGPLPPPPVPSKMFRVTVPSLKVRAGAGTTFNQLGSIVLNEIVEEIGANSDRSWLNIRKLDQSLTGWSFSAYLQNTNAPAPDPVPDPPPDPEDKNWLRVTTSSLKVREGPGLTFNSLGNVRFGDLVEEFDATPDRAWLKIRNEDGSLIGWSSGAYLQKVSIPPTPTPASKWYRVTTTSLNVREKPDLTSASLGHVNFGDFVEELEANSDRTWLRIRKSNGSITGWSFSQYLKASAAPGPDDIPPTPIPDNNDKKWYRVNTLSLNVREGPAMTNKILGTVLKNDTIPALDDTSNPGWIKIQKLDGLTGWCDRKFLVLLSATRPASIRQGLFPGITYLRKDLTTPRLNVVHVLAIDLQTLNLEFLVTPASKQDGTLCTRTTSKFLEEFKLHLAINADGWRYLDPGSVPGGACASGDPVKVNGYAASRGTVYSPVKTYEPEIYIGPRNQVTINTPPVKPFNAFAGDRVVVQNGIVVKNLAATIPQPRTALGLNKNGRWLTLMVVDGRQDGYSEGVTFPELGELLISYGVYTGVNLDGGGSSTMVMKGMDGKPRILNSPIDLNVPGKERAVANHLGLYIRK
ncbi:MAG: SH3 domain-containing protein [Chloroflexi bacterium]|nr:SH3 domain-containing protein [Chloroflexota bacterium]